MAVAAGCSLGDGEAVEARSERTPVTSPAEAAEQWLSALQAGDVEQACSLMTERTQASGFVDNFVSLPTDVEDCDDLVSQAEAELSEVEASIGRPVARGPNSCKNDGVGQKTMRADLTVGTVPAGVLLCEQNGEWRVDQTVADVTTELG
ncbi:MAG: hypothetical protein ACR2N5_08245 [Solirubrobacterales bacterium]